MMEIFKDPLVLYYVSAVLMAIPVARIFTRAGFRPWWAVLLAVPEAGLILCAAVLAIGKWRKA